MSIKSAEELFEHLLQDMYYAEKKLVKVLEDMSEKATDKKLAKGFLDHKAETEKQVERLERVLELCDFDVKGEKCDAIDGLVEEGKKLAKEAAEGPIRDAALIAAAQKVEHYEIASYGTICELANTLGHSEAADILGETLEEEKACDEKLTEIAESKVNEKASRAAA